MLVVNIRKQDELNHNCCVRGRKEELTAIGNLTPGVA